MAINTESPVTQDAGLAAFEARYGKLGGRERREFKIGVERTYENADPNSAYSVNGHASVFSKRSLDLGGFEEVIMPGAFDEILRQNPDVLLLWDHDTSRPLARTTNDSLKLNTDEIGLKYHARVANTSYAQDLRVLLDDEIINQASFAFTIAEGGQEWRVEGPVGEEVITRFITKINGLYDCTICARGAYPDATSGLDRSYLRSYAEAHGLELPEERDVTVIDAEDQHLYEGDGGPCEICGGDVDDANHTNVDDPEENSAPKAGSVAIARAKAHARARR